MSETWIEKKETERVRVALSEYQGRNYVDIRTYFLGTDGEWKPTQKGISLPTEKLPELKEAINNLQI